MFDQEGTAVTQSKSVTETHQRQEIIQIQYSDAFKALTGAHKLSNVTETKGA